MCYYALLIVPYGIEIFTLQPFGNLTVAFNRTLWN